MSIFFGFARFDQNATDEEVIGNWKAKPDGKGQGPLGFGTAIKFKTEEVSVLIHSSNNLFPFKYIS